MDVRVFDWFLCGLLGVLVDIRVFDWFPRWLLWCTGWMLGFLTGS